MPIKLYTVHAGPPSLCCRMAFEALNIKYENYVVNFYDGEHLTDKFDKMNPQKEIPILDDNGFILSESTAILQYIGDKFDEKNLIYSKDSKIRGIINQRLCFYSSLYYSTILRHIVAPIYYDYPRNDTTLNHMKYAINMFEIYLKRKETKWIADNKMTLADIALIPPTQILEAIEFDLSGYPCIQEWYKLFKNDYPKLFKIGDDEMYEIRDGWKKPIKMSMKSHHLHPLRKN